MLVLCLATACPAPQLCLLQDASSSSADAVFELADLYENGFFGRVDYVQARRLYLEGANRGNPMCFRPLATLLAGGHGGAADVSTAYFWGAADTAFVDPRSVGGQEAWQARTQFGRALGLRELKEQWLAFDRYVEQVKSHRRTLTLPRFLEGAIPATDSAEASRLRDKAERDYRARMNYSRK